ncbi:unnamed protein product, partial [Rodentolepis nana]
MLLASSDISEHTRRISSWLQATSASIHAAPGSGHKPVIASITFGLLVTNQSLLELKRKRDAQRNNADQTG